VTEGLDLRRAWPHAAGVFAALLALYAATAPRAVVFEDDGLFILAARSLGLPQPPGYPLLVLLGKLASLVPLGTLAYRVHLVSAVCGAATCAVLWIVLQQLFRDTLASWAGALLLGVSAAFWSQSIIAEVYTLNTLLFFAAVSLALQLGAVWRPRTAHLLAACYGLSLADHWPLIGLSTPCLALLLVPRWREVLRRIVPLAATALACAAIPYALMVIRSHQHPEANFYGPIRSLKEFWFFFSRKGFGEIDVSETASAGDRLRYLGFLAKESVRQFTPAGAALGALGFALQWRRLARGAAWALLAGFLGSSFLLAFLLSFDYDVLFQSVIRVYPLIPYGILAVWVVLGGRFLLARLPRPARAAAWAALVALTLAVHVRQNHRAGETFARDYARAVLASLEPNAVLVLHGDMDTFPLAHERLVEGIRPDVTLYNDQGLLLDNRLFEFSASLAERQRILGSFIRATTRPVYFVESAPEGFSLQDAALQMKVRRDVPPGQIFFDLPDATLAFVDRMEEETSTDAWTVFRRDQLRRRYAKVLSFYKFYQPDAFATGNMADVHERLARTPQGVLGVLDLLLSPDKGVDQAGLLEYAGRAEAVLGGASSKSDRALPAYARGRALFEAGRIDDAEAAYRDSLAVYPSHQNRAVLGLLRCYAETGRRAEFMEATERYLVGRRLPPAVLTELNALKAKVER
jgi:tetratricopeptide (TPR) repeat protein